MKSTIEWGTMSNHQQLPAPHDYLARPGHAMRVLIGVFVLGMLTACVAAPTRLMGGSEITQWSEEVELNDGQRLIVHFSKEKDPNLPRELGQPPRTSRLAFEFAHPISRERIAWETRFGSDPEKTGLGVMTIDIVNGISYLVTLPVHCIDYNKAGRPNPPYVIFRYDNNVWKRIDITDLPSVVKKRNIGGGSSGGPLRRKTEEGYVSIADKDYWMNVGKSREAVQIVREPMAHGDVNPKSCPVMFYYGAGWRSINLFEGKQSIEGCEALCHRTHIPQGYCPCSEIFEKRE